jgi:hypothetical protein
LAVGAREPKYDCTIAGGAATGCVPVDFRPTNSGAGRIGARARCRKKCGFLLQDFHVTSAKRYKLKAFDAKYISRLLFDRLNEEQTRGMTKVIATQASQSLLAA